MKSLLLAANFAMTDIEEKNNFVDDYRYELTSLQKDAKKRKIKNVAIFASFVVVSNVLVFGPLYIHPNN